MSEYITRVTQKCDEQHEKTVLSHKGTAGHVFNAVAIHLTAIKMRNTYNDLYHIYPWHFSQLRKRGIEVEKRIQEI